MSLIKKSLVARAKAYAKLPEQKRQVIKKKAESARYKPIPAVDMKKSLLVSAKAYSKLPQHKKEYMRARAQELRESMSESNRKFREECGLLPRN